MINDDAPYPKQKRRVNNQEAVNGHVHSLRSNFSFLRLPKAERCLTFLVQAMRVTTGGRRNFEIV